MVHPSRHRSYEGIDIDPLEAMFVKTQWRVSEQQVHRYSRWMDTQLREREDRSASQW